MSTVQSTISPRPSSAAMDLLSKGVPLSLLCDLAMGPFSEELMAVERVPSQREAR